MADLRISDEFEAISSDPNRHGQMDVVLVYYVDARGPFYHHSPKTGFNYDKAVRDIQAQERQRAQHVGRTFSL